MANEPNFEQLERSVVEQYNALEEVSPKNFLLEMAVVEKDRLVKFNPSFDREYNRADVQQRYQNYIRDLRTAREATEAAARTTPF